MRGARAGRFLGATRWPEHLRTLGGHRHHAPHPPRPPPLTNPARFTEDELIEDGVEHVKHRYTKIDLENEIVPRGLKNGTLRASSPSSRSDHGFAPYRRDFHANTWLLENGYLALKPGVRREDVDFLSGVDWRRTRAYALGINGIYLNLRGREKNGIVRTGEQQEKLLAEICAGLEAAVDPEVGRPAVKIAYRTDQVYAGDAREHGPDIVVGYHRGWRGSNESALGAIAPQVFADNLKKWSGDHCIAADEVPGVILTNRPLTVADPSLLDMAPTILRRFGLTPPDAMEGRDIFGR